MADGVSILDAPLTGEVVDDLYLPIVSAAGDRLRANTTQLRDYAAAVSLPLSYLDTDDALAADSDEKVASQKAVKALVTAERAAAEAASIPLSYLDADDTFTANSNTRVPSQRAVKTYVDALLEVQDAMVFKGVLDCSSNPNYPAADRGATYRVSVAGKIGGASGVNVEAGDLLTCITDDTASGNHATVGAQWTISQANIDGAVVGPASATNSHFAQFDGTSGKLLKGGLALDTDGTLAANSATRVPSQSAVVTALAAKQAAHANLSAFAGLTLSANELPYANGSGTLAMTTLSAFGRTLIDDANAAAGRSTLELGTASTQNTGTSGATVPLLNGANTWSDQQNLNGNVSIQNATPLIGLYETDQSANNIVWFLPLISGGVASFGPANDALSLTTSFSIDRSAVTTFAVAPVISAATPRMWLHESDQGTDGKYVSIDQSAGIVRFSFTADNQSGFAPFFRAARTANAVSYTEVGGEFRPSVDDSFDLGNASFRWDDIRATNATIQTSDARDKTAFAPLSEGVKRAIRALLPKIGSYQWLSSVAEKGDAARHHVGLSAQIVRDAFIAEGEDPAQWALFCADEIFEDVEDGTVEEIRVVMEDFEDAEVTVEDGRAIRRPAIKQRPIIDLLPLFEDDGETPVMLAPLPVVNDAGEPVLGDGGQLLFHPAQQATIAVKRTEIVQVPAIVTRPKLDEHGAPLVRLGLRYTELIMLALAVMSEDAGASA